MHRQPDLASLPPVFSRSLREETRKLVASSDRKIVVIDDDPTGTQTVSGIAALLSWSPEALASELTDNRPAFFILSNSRSMTEAEAADTARHIGQCLTEASRRTGVRFSIISRSDSTLRGHFPSEVECLTQALGLERPSILLAPAFIEGGRITVDDVHYVREAEGYVPVADTEFARDPSFGFSRSNLREWVAEKTGGRISADAVLSITLDDIRHDGPARVERILHEMEPGRVAIVNAVDSTDLDVVGYSLAKCETQRKTFVVRSAASMVASRLGCAPRMLRKADLARSASTAGGLVVVGSFVSRTSRQLDHLLHAHSAVRCELPFRVALDQSVEDLMHIAADISRHIESGRHVVLCTERTPMTGATAEESRSIGKRISAAVNTVVSAITARPSFIIGKGGITSHEIASVCCGARRIEVAGQIRDGVPVWRLGEESKYPGMPYIVFPGNVGDDTTLTQVFEELT